MKKHLSILALCSTLSACSATGPQFDASEMKKPTPSKVQLVIYREGGFMGSAMKWTVKINGQDTCALPQGSYFTREAQPGKTKIGFEGKVYSFDLKSGERAYFQVSLRGGSVLAEEFGPLGIAVDASSSSSSEGYSHFNIRRQYEADALNDLSGLKQSTDCK